MASKSEVIQAILRHNTSVNEEFLSQFSDDELTRYLTRLGFTEGRRFEWQSDADAFVDGAFGYRRASA
ncbi:MAG: hypothetical protein AABZ12_14295 [Planctomycetota bacterium]